MSGDNERTIKRNTKQDILNTCIDLFSEVGFSSVSIRDITRKVGINESSFYNHYKNKDEILDRIIEKFTQDFGKSFSADTAALERQMIGVEPEVFFQYHLIKLRDSITPEIQKIWRIIYMEMFRNIRIRDFFINIALKKSAEYYERIFEVMMDKNLIKRVDPKILSDEYNYALMGFQIENLLLKADDADIADNAKKMVAHIRFLCDAIKI